MAATRTQRLAFTREEFGVQELAAAARKGRIFASIGEIDAAIRSGELRGEVVRAGTLYIHEAKDHSFKEVVEARGLRFFVPELFRGEKNCAIVVHSPFYAIDNGIVKIGEFQVVRQFPRTIGWYAVDPQTGVPMDIPLNGSDESARYLVRTNNAGIGTFVMNSNPDPVVSRHIRTGFYPEDSFRSVEIDVAQLRRD